MRFFTCIIGAEGRPVPERLRRAYASMPLARALRCHWHTIAQVSVLVGGDTLDERPVLATNGDCAAAGWVRLDNRAELEQWAACSGGDHSDLDLVLHIVAQHGTTYIPRFLGDFAFVVWNATTRVAVAACDALAVKKLYYADRDGVLAFASRGEALALDERYDVQYLAERVAACVPSPGRSVYAGVKAVPAGTLAVVQHGKLSLHRYWSAHDFDMKPTWASSAGAPAETCRTLLAESVRRRLGHDGETWAQLSGGLDSSSVVSVSQWLAANGEVPGGLGGTVTYVDSCGTGADERDYSNAVVRRWPVRNEQIVDFPIWHSDRYALPRTDEPSLELVFYPRDCHLCTIVREAGGRILLTGGGGDTLFTGNMFFFADWVARGRIRAAAREMLRRAARGRVSFWELAYRNALLPLLPRTVQHRLVRDVGQMPPWVARAAARAYDLPHRASAPFSYAGRIGHKYHDAIAAAVGEVPASAPVGIIEDTLDVRHPFLYRPLVEFALQLPPELCARPNARKWVLREAMREILPERVRTRIGKGTSYGRLSWSLTAQRALLEPLVREPILADLGIIDATKLRTAFDAAAREPDGREKIHGAIHDTLAVEAWLQMRSGRWPRGGHVRNDVPASYARHPSQ